MVSTLVGQDPCEGLGPVDFHCHGIGCFDFTEIDKLDLPVIEDLLAKRKQRSVLTLYLPKSGFMPFLDLMEKFGCQKNQGKYPHIVGLALEGPLLASHGGTPEMGVWSPSKEEWVALSECGPKGLIYVIFSPDVDLKDSNFFYAKNKPDIAWITETLLDKGVLPAPGHFVKSSPIESAKRLQLVFDIVAHWGQCPTITDHLYNDMPHNFKHAWRTADEKKSRTKEINELKMLSWSLDNLAQKTGPVPATMIHNARKGIVKICQNFDGEHVDLEVIKNTVRLVGTDNLLMMTDSIESRRLAGRDLHIHEGSGLLYQDSNIVAAGSSCVGLQIENMKRIGILENDIQIITEKIPQTVLHARDSYIKALDLVC